MLRSIKKRLSRIDNGDSRRISSRHSSVTNTPSPTSRITEKEDLSDRSETSNYQKDPLASFHACVEAADALAASSGQENKLLPSRIDEVTGLNDCSVLVSPDGDLLLIPQNINDHRNLKKDTSSSTFLFKELMLNGKDDYESAVFLGNDLNPQGDKALNGFSAKGWSIPAATVALQQTEHSLNDLRHFVQDLARNRREISAQTIVACDKLKRHAPSMGGSPRSISLLDDWELVDFEPTKRRVGPLVAPVSTLNAALVALEHYYSVTAEQESKHWRSSERNGVMHEIQRNMELVSERTRKRQQALDQAFLRAQQMEDNLTRLKKTAEKRWEAVYQAEDKVTQKVEGIMQERSREREKQRLEKLRQDEAMRVRDAANGSLGATSEEIWDIVSAVAESMEDGSFEPMDLPAAPLSVPRDRSMDRDECQETSDGESEKDSIVSLPMVSREQIELEVGLPELRSIAMASDEAVADAADELMNILSTLDTTRRTARVAAEACLVSACNAQASCIRSLIKLEQTVLENRLKELKELESATEKIDVRADLDAYISSDKQDRGGSSKLGDDDDGGIAAALAILSRHVDGSMGVDPTNRLSIESVNDAGDNDDSSVETIDDTLDTLFDMDNDFFSPKSPESGARDKARASFQSSVDYLSLSAEGNGISARGKRSKLCYALNSKRSSNAEIATPIQFDALCQLFASILTGCNAEEGGGVSNAKMCIMLAQTFYLGEDDSGVVEGAVAEDSENDLGCGKARDHRIYVKSRLRDHPLWLNEDFWDHALSQQISESLSHSGLMANFEKRKSPQRKIKSEWTQSRKTKWYDLSHAERLEAASQVHAVVFAQLGALAHSMIELGCGLERSCAFVRRMSIRHQLPSSQRTMLLQHLMARDDLERRESQVDPSSSSTSNPDQLIRDDETAA